MRTCRAPTCPLASCMPTPTTLPAPCRCQAAVLVGQTWDQEGTNAFTVLFIGACCHAPGSRAGRLMQDVRALADEMIKRRIGPGAGHGSMPEYRVTRPHLSHQAASRWRQIQGGMSRPSQALNRCPSSTLSISHAIAPQHHACTPLAQICPPIMAQAGTPPPAGGSCLSFSARSTSTSSCAATMPSPGRGSQ